MTRFVLIALLFAVHAASATIDIEKIKEMKTAVLHSAVEKLKDLKDTAAYNIQHLGDDIDLNNLHKLDILKLGPKLQKKYNLLKELYKKPMTKVNVVHIYGDDLASHFEHGKVVKYHHDHDNLHSHHGFHDHEDIHVHHDHHGHHGHHHGHYHDVPLYVLKRTSI